MQGLIVLWALLIALPAYAADLRIYHIDVEQADATLILSPSGKTLLVDSGKNGQGSRLKAVMDQAGVTQIDHFLATHYHEDHYGGIDELVEDEGVTAVQAYDRGDKVYLPASTTNAATYKDYQRAVGEDAEHLKRGETIALDPQMSVTCISSGGVVIGEDPAVHGRDENDMSVSLLVTYGGFRYFVGGDIEAATEAKIAARDLVRDVDVYQANHHGSDTSSSADFLKDLSPTVIVISNGNHAGYGHPKETTLEFFAGPELTPKPTVFQTNKYLAGARGGGNVGDAFIADPETVDDDGTILVTVDSAASRYTVSYGANTMHTFAVKGSGSTGAVVIENLLPNPVGNDAELEEVTLRNRGTESVSLVGWTLVDQAGSLWDLTAMGTIAPGESATVVRNGMAMSLNNSGDVITVKDFAGHAVDSFSYTGSNEGEPLETGH